MDDRLSAMRRAGMILAGTFGLMVAYPLLAVGIYDFSRPQYELESSREEHVAVDADGHRRWTRVHILRFECYGASELADTLIGGQAAFDMGRTLAPVFRPLLQAARLHQGDGYRIRERFPQSTNPNVHFCSHSHISEVIER